LDKAEVNEMDLARIHHHMQLEEDKQRLKTIQEALITNSDLYADGQRPAMRWKFSMSAGDGADQGDGFDAVTADDLANDEELVQMQLADEMAQRRLRMLKERVVRYSWSFLK
jgi:hypothetical protein